MSFANRIQLVMDEYNLEPRAFAEKIGVQRSSISHLTSGRNKPSADFLIKLTETFPEIDPRWLLHGIGSLKSPEPIETEKDVTYVTKDRLDALEILDKPIDHQSQKTEINRPVDKRIERIILVFSDGTFEELNPKN